jgi:AraC-like DNA-binding protein
MEPAINPVIVRQFVRFAATMEIPVQSMLDGELLSQMATSSLDQHVPARAVVDILQICSERMRRPDLGAAFAAWINKRGYGPLSLVPDTCSSISEFVNTTARYLRFENGAIAPSVVESEDEIAIGYLLVIPTMRGGTQLIEALLMLAMRGMQSILGEDWRPLRVEFNHMPPTSLRNHRTLFQCPLEFGADQSAIIISRKDWTRRTQSGDADLLTHVQKLLSALNSIHPDDFVGQVEHMIAAGLVHGGARLDVIADKFAIAPRTLQRRLTDEGISFAQLLEKVRRRLAEDYLQHEKRPCLNELAHRLGFSDASAASRFLKSSLGMGIRQALRGRLKETA